MNVGKARSISQHDNDARLSLSAPFSSLILIAWNEANSFVYALHALGFKWFIAKASDPYLDHPRNNIFIPIGFDRCLLGMLINTVFSQINSFLSHGRDLVTNHSMDLHH